MAHTVKHALKFQINRREHFPILFSSAYPGHINGLFPHFTNEYYADYGIWHDAGHRCPGWVLSPSLIVATQYYRVYDRRIFIWPQWYWFV